MPLRQHLSQTFTGFKDFFAITIWVFRFYARIHRVQFITLILVSIALEFAPLLSSWLLAYIIDQATLLKAQPQLIPTTLTTIAIMTLTYRLITMLLRNIYGYITQKFGTSTDPLLRQQIGDKLRSVGVQVLEGPDTVNLITRAESASGRIMHYFEQILNLTATIITFFGTLLVISHFMPIIIPLMFLTAIPTFFLDTHFLKKLWKYDIDSTESRRLAYTSLYALSNPRAVQEISLTRGHKLFTSKVSRFFGDYLRFNHHTRKVWYFGGLIISLPRILLETASGLWIIYRHILGFITLGQITFYISLINQSISTLTSINTRFTNLNEMTARIKELKQIFDLAPAFPDGTTNLSVLKTGPGIKFSSVSFRYPNTTKNVLTDIDIDIKPGEKIAIVGNNGAGKTTLVKLICRYYQTTTGEILINDNRLNDLKIDSWYQNIGVLFQDYNLFEHLTPSESIRIGRYRHNFDPKEISTAAKMAEAHDFISTLPDGYQTILSERYKGGVRPSTGQAQKIVIARFFYRNAPLAIFDEPTASIDALAEKKIFDRIYQFFTGKTVILISHRFSTVRNADRIIVLDQGRIAEQGSHTQLMKQKGIYAHSFQLQAAGYK